MSDSENVTQVLAGNTSRFQALLHKYAPMVRGLCASHVYDPGALDDLVQESFVAGYVNLHTLRDRRKFGPWIAQITRNKCQSWLRERVREERGQDRLRAEPLPNANPDPLSQLARKELCEWVRTQIGSLPDKTREAMLLCYVEGLKIREAAQFLDASESSIKKRLQYGRDQLGEKIWNELGELKRPATDEQPLCTKVMAALPLASAPWNVAGTTAATTGAATVLAGKAGIVTAVLAVLGIVVGVVAWTSQTNETVEDDVRPALIADGVTDRMLDESAQPFDSSVATATPIDGGSGNLAVNLYYQTPAKTNDTAQEDPIPVQGAQVWLAPKVFHKERMESALKDADVPADVIEALVAVNEHIHAPGGPEPPRKLTEADVHTLRERVIAESRKPGMGDLMARMDQAGEIGPQETWASGKTGPDGTLVLSDLAAGPYKAYVQLAGEDRPTRMPSENAINTFDLYVQPNASREETLYVLDTVSAIQGTLRDAETGNPITDEPVQISGDIVGEEHLEQQTDEIGQFEFDPQATGFGPYVLQAGGLKYAPLVEEDERIPGVPCHQEIALSKYGEVSGHVYMSDGRPAPGAKILLEEPVRYSRYIIATADADGFYSAHHDGGTLYLRAGGVSVETETVELELGMHETAIQDFYLGPAAGAIFDIRTPEGTVPDRIRQDTLFQDRTTHTGSGLTRIGDSYVLTYLTPAEYCLVLRVEGYSLKVVEFTIEDDPKDVHIPVFLNTQGNRLTVSVVDDVGIPVADAPLSVQYLRRIYDPVDHDLRELSASVRPSMESTDSTGLASLEGLPDGEYRITVAEVSQEVKLPHTEILQFAVVGSETSTDSKSDKVYLRKEGIQLVDTANGNVSLNSEYASTFTVAPSGGIARGGELVVGDNLLYVVKSGYPLGKATISISPEFMAEFKGKTVFTDEKVRVEIGQGGTAFGLVTKPDGSPAAGQPLRVIPAELRTDDADAIDWYHFAELANAIAQSARTDAYGSFSLPYLADGEYYVFADRASAWDDAELIRVELGLETGPLQIIVE